MAALYIFLLCVCFVLDGVSKMFYRARANILARKAAKRAQAPPGRHAGYITVTYQQLDRRRIQRTRQAERQAAQAEKARQLAEKRRRKKEQAEIDINFYQSHLDILADLSYKNDIALQEIYSSIKKDKLQRLYDSAREKEKTAEKLLKKQISLDNQMHMLEKRIAAAQYIINDY